MQVEISKSEAVKIVDAIESYTKNYSVPVSVQKTFSNIIKKLKDVINQ